MKKPGEQQRKRKKEANRVNGNISPHFCAPRKNTKATDAGGQGEKTPRKTELERERVENSCLGHGGPQAQNETEGAKKEKQELANFPKAYTNMGFSANLYKGGERGNGKKRIGVEENTGGRP